MTPPQINGGDGEPRRKRKRASSAVDQSHEDTQQADDELAACQSCRKRKSRCSRAQPCSQCNRLGVECTYDERRRPGVRTGAIEAITQRLSNLEQMFLGQGLLLQPLLSPQSRASDSGGKPESGGNALQDQVYALKSALVQASSRGDIATQWENHLPAAGTTQTQRPSSQFVADQWDASIASEPELPSEQVVNQLVEWYFANVHRWIPILHVRRFREKLRTPSTRARNHSILIAIVSLGMKFSQPEGMDPNKCEAVAQRCRHAVILRSMERFSVENLQALVITAFDTIGSGRGPSSWSVIGSMARTVEQLRLNVEGDEHGQEQTGTQSYLMQRIAFLRPARSWVEAEERRRLFWAVFMMDRFCGVATGWNNSVTGGDVRRRLPCEGALWEAETPVKTPFFGIAQDPKANERQTATPLGDRSVSDPEEVDAIGGFAFCLEATETLNLVTDFFLHQPVRFDDPQGLQLWLMQFKELDLRLVKWRLFLPEKWRNASVLNQDGIMDPNLTLAHITHNTAVIQLHQCVAFPPPALRQCAASLPSATSADTCVMAATEIGTIAQQFLQQSNGITHPQLSFCLFMAGRVLLAPVTQNAAGVHPTFDVISAALRDIACRWDHKGQSAKPSENLAARLTKRLSEARAAARTNASDHTLPSSIDISRPVYYEDAARSRAVSVGPVEEVSTEVDQGGGARNLTQHISPVDQSPDPFAFAYPPVPADWGQTMQPLGGMAMEQFSNRVGASIGNVNHLNADSQCWDGIEGMFDADFQQMLRVTMYDNPGFGN